MCLDCKRILYLLLHYLPVILLHNARILLEPTRGINGSSYRQCKKELHMKQLQLFKDDLTGDTPLV